jgi:hypothetical protein
VVMARFKYIKKQPRFLPAALEQNFMSSTFKIRSRIRFSRRLG